MTERRDQTAQSHLRFREERPDEAGLDPPTIAERRIAAWRQNPTESNSERLEFAKKRFGSSTRELDLEGLGLQKVPESVRQLTSLENLNVGGNRITAVPRWIGELSELKGINLSRNRLSRLPATIGALRNLAILWLQQNKLKDLPIALRDLPLRELMLDGNPRLQLPESVTDRPPEEILRYYFESRADEGRPLRELKLLLVGRGKAGKTTLVKRLANEPPDEHESETHSISIRELTFNCERGDVRGRVWDFGGQEILHSTHQFFLTERSLYLLVLEPRTGLAQYDAEYWLKLIEAQGGGSPAIVILNWSFGRPWRIDEVRLKRKFPFIVAFVQADALHGVGIDVVRDMIAEAIATRMPDVWFPFPKKWREIKNAVGGMRENFLTYEEYVAVCEQYGESRPEAQADLAGILHALGLALYFGKDPRLHDTRVLNPSWVTGGVYAVIRAPSVAKRNGQLALGDMPRILREAEIQKTIAAVDYPKPTHGFILELMRAFQLCYASEERKGRPTRYLVPELLPPFEPELPDQWDQSDIRLRYRYEVLPPSLLPRFIVRTHALSEEAPHWRHGVVLRHAGAQALIRDESERHEVHVFVLGADHDTRGVLVAMVRRELEMLHDEMRMQPIEELELAETRDQWISVKALRQIERVDAATQVLPVQPDGTAEVNVARELDRIVPAEARAIDRNPAAAPIPIRLFVSYAHDDERQLKRLDAMLDVLEQQHGLASWTDRRLIAGDEWDNEIRRRLEEMDIFLLIASQASLVRPYVRDPEIRRAQERYELGDVEVVTVKLEPCACDEDPFLGKRQRLAPKFKSIAEATLRSLAWEQVRKDLLPVINRVKSRKIERRAAVLSSGSVSAEHEGDIRV